MRVVRQRTVERDTLAADLSVAGLRPGDTVLVHSALSAVGWVKGGPQEAIRAFFDILGPEGTLVMPSFSFNLQGWGLPPFDAWRTPSRVGMLTDTFWRMAGVDRSTHPTHSVAAIGPRAWEIVGGPLHYEPLGIGSPVDRVRRLGGKILLLGVGHIRNSTIHLAESLAGVPYLDVNFTEGQDFDAAYYLPEQDGSPRLLKIHQMPGSSEGFDTLTDHLRAVGIARAVTVGAAPSEIMPAEPLCREVVRMLGEDPTLLLKNAPTSEITARRLKKIEGMLQARAV